LLLHCQLDESCVSQHVGERKVRTLEEEEDDVASSLGGEASTDVETASAAVDELDIEELASAETNSDDLGENTDEDEDDYEGTGHSDDIYTSSVLSADVGNSDNIGSSFVPDNDADIVNTVLQTGRSHADEISKDAVDSASLIGQADSSAVGGVTASVEAEMVGSVNEKLSDAGEEFPDTSIDLQHISGNKCVVYIVFIVK